MTALFNALGRREKRAVLMGALGAASLLTACGSPPVTSYYTLTPPPKPLNEPGITGSGVSGTTTASPATRPATASTAGTASTASTAGVAPSNATGSASAASAGPAGPAGPAWWIDVMPVGLPESLDQPQLVIRKSDSAVVVLEQARWSSPLSQELRGALSAQLSRRLGTQDVNGLSAPAGRDVLRIKVQMRRFEAWPGEQVHLAADWTIVQSTHQERRVSCHTELSQPAGADVGAVVQAQQRLVASLSDAVAAVAARWPQASCSAG